MCLIKLAIKLLIGTAVFSGAISTVTAGPGYVSRDCYGAGTKEAITLDWSNNKHYFYTIAQLPRISGSTYRWETNYNSAHSLYALPVGKRITRDAVNAVKSHAGIFASRAKVKQYREGTYGNHYWYNPLALRWESRRTWVTSCNLGEWGRHNW